MLALASLALLQTVSKRPVSTSLLSYEVHSKLPMELSMQMTLHVNAREDRSSTLLVDFNSRCGGQQW